MKLLKNNKEVILGLLIGILLTGSTVYANNLIIEGSEISYDNTESNLSNDNVQDAIDELCNKSSSCQKIRNNTVYFDIKDPTTASTTDYTTLNKKVFAARNGDQRSICIIRNNKLHCFDGGNFAVEYIHVKEVFSGIDCFDDDRGITCNDGAFACYASSSGLINITSYEDSLRCFAYNGGYTGCETQKS